MASEIRALHDQLREKDFEVERATNDQTRNRHQIERLQ